MNKVLYIILISLFSLTIISCAKNDDSSSSSSSSDANSSTDNSDNSCPLDNNRASTNRSDSETGSRSSEQTGRVLYVDKSALSQYQTDDYLLLDPYRSNSNFCGNIRPPRGTPVNCDEVDLGDSGPILGSQF
ncbi:MAG TPA: hypothetical protein EYN33_01195, partial [Gammaproteobacteria bacterium]|nr:hypothetical protein [Gammaproteobacteria bacterium]